MEAAKNRVVIASSSAQRKREKRKRRRRRKEKRVVAPSSLLTEVIEEIFLRLPIKALIRLKLLSKQWRETIESLSFAERHLKIAERTRVVHPKFMVVAEENPLKGTPGEPRTDTDIGFYTFCLESASRLSYTLLNFPQGFCFSTNVSQSCNGLFCIYSTRTQSIYVVNPATRWLRQLPPARFQILMHKFNPTAQDRRDMDSILSAIAFVKAADYKLVWLYNSDKYNADALSPNEGLTKCEVFDFRSNAWRYLNCTPSYRIFPDKKPVYAEGSVYWLTEPYNARIKVVAFDIRTETFSLLPKIIPAIAATSDPNHIDMCTLDNGLCMSRRDPVTMIQEIWRLKPSKDTWEKILSIDLVSCPSPRTEIRDRFEWSDKYMFEPSSPVAVCKNKKILLSHCYSRGLVKYDPLTKSLDFVFAHPFGWRKVTYFQSLISHI